MTEIVEIVAAFTMASLGVLALVAAWCIYCDVKKTIRK